MFRIKQRLERLEARAENSQPGVLWPEDDYNPTRRGKVTWAGRVIAQSADEFRARFPNGNLIKVVRE